MKFSPLFVWKFSEDDARKRIGSSIKKFNIILKNALAILLRDKTKRYLQYSIQSIFDECLKAIALHTN